MKASQKYAMSRSAFTLMEVLVVIALIGGIGAFVVVDFAGISNQWTQSTDVESLMQSVAFSRESSLSTHRRVRLTFSVGEHALVARCGDEVRRFPLKGTVKFVLPSDEIRASTREVGAVEFASEADATPVVFVLEGMQTHRFRLEPFSQALSQESR